MTTTPRTPIGEPKVGAIKVGSEILVHLGQGIYSTPANAIKELISNAYDADATKVTIRAKPDMDNLVVMDNGDGMNEEEFEQHFAIVAKSFRRQGGPYSRRLRRPIIGRFGIGFLAISQICDRIRIISSKQGEAFRFEAAIDFKEYRTRAKQVAEYEYEIAPYVLTNYPEDADQHYTVVILEGLAAGFRNDLLDKRLDSPSEELPGRYARTKEDLTGQSFEYIAERLLTGRTRGLHRHLGGYWVFLLELSVIVPVVYLENGPIHFSQNARRRFSEQAGKIEQIKAAVSGLQFAVDFDGVELRKPFLLPSAYFPKAGREIGEDEYHVDFFEFDENVAGERLAYKGYLYNQRFSIAPGELHGVAIRIKNTSIGGMRQDFLEYPAPEKLFFQQSMGEVYVEEGLEDAMNIDRATFRIGHPHYSALQDFLHRRLARLFRESRGRYVRRRKAQDVALQDVVLAQLRELFGTPFNLRTSGRTAAVPVELDTPDGTATVYRGHEAFRGLSAAERRMRASDLILFEAAVAIERDRDRIRDLYYRLLAERGGTGAG